MKTINISVMWLFPLGLLVAGGGAFVAYKLSRPDTPVVEPAPAVAAPEKPAEPKLDNDLTDAEFDAMIAALEDEARPAPAVTEFDPEDLEARRERWESMSMEQRQMLRKAMFAALSKIDGLEEVGEAIRQGQVDPRQFKMDPVAIADRMEFLAETMDQKAMEEEVTRTLQDMVDQARAQMK